MGGRPYPSTSEVTRTRPRREEWPCPGSRRRQASWRQRSAQRSSVRHSWHTAKLASTRKHAAHIIAEQSKALYHNNGGGQPHHPPQAPRPAQHPTPRVGARPTTRALHPRTAIAARKQGTRASLKGRPRGLGLGPANWWAALSKRFGGYQTRPQWGERPCLGSRGHHASRRQRSARRRGSVAHNAAQQTKAGKRHTMKCASTRQHAAHSTAEQSNVVYRNNNGGQPHHPPRAPTPAQHTTPRVGPDPPHGHFTHTQPPPPTNKARTWSITKGPRPHAPTPKRRPPHT